MDKDVYLQAQFAGTMQAIIDQLPSLGLMLLTSIAAMALGVGFVAMLNGNGKPR